MMKYLITAALLTLSTFCLNAQGLKIEKALICLTYDDGLPSHLTTVLPQLDSFNLKATFFLNAIQGSSDRVGEVSKAVTGLEPGSGQWS